MKLQASRPASPQRPSLLSRRLEAVRDVAVRLAVLARDEVRTVCRSRRGRVLGAIYLLLSLLPLALYLWIRARYVVVWPVDACDVAGYLRGHRLLDLVLILVLGHDLLSRGDHEGWQDGFATLPVGELTWLCGRLLGRLACLVVVISAPSVIGWVVASLWGGCPLDPLPFAAILLGRPALSLALLFPLVVLAGCVGSSLGGATVVLLAGICTFDVALNVSLGHARDLGLCSELSGTYLSCTWICLAEEDGTLGVVVRLGYALFSERIRPYEYLPYWAWVGFSADGGRFWPPLRSEHQLAGGVVTVAAWLLFLSLVPYLLRLRRRTGRLQLRLPQLPSFSRWLSELVEQARPTRPEGAVARLLAMAASLLLVAAFAWQLPAVAEIGAREQAITVAQIRPPAIRPWPAVLMPKERELELRLAADGALHGRQVLRGWVTVTTSETGGRLGERNLPVPFALAPGIQVLEVSDRQGRRLQWQRGAERLWVLGLPPGEQQITFVFRGRPHRVERATVRVRGNQGPDVAWSLTSPLLLPLVASGQRHWLVDLGDLSWAPEPLRFVPERATYRGREPCWGTTSLRLSVPTRLVPMPLPGDWQEEATTTATVVRWRGTAPLLPPVIAGRLYRLQEEGVTAVARSAGTDLQGMLNRWGEVWDQLPVLPVAGSLVLRCFSSGPQRPSWYWWHKPSYDPELASPPGLVTLPDDHEQRSVAAQDQAAWEIGRLVRRARARFRFLAVAHRLTGGGPQLIRRFLWTLCNQLEQPASERDLAVGPALEESFRAFDLSLPLTADRSQQGRVQEKLELIGTATVNVLTPDGVEKGLQRLVAGHGPLTMDQVWSELATERAGELRWFRDQVLFGTGMAVPLLDRVTVEDSSASGGGWRAEVTIRNDGDALTVVPLRFVGPQGKRTRRVRLEAGARVQVSERFDSPVEQVLLDPDGEVLRRLSKYGMTWTRWGGIR